MNVLLGYVQVFRKANAYSIYVLAILLATYLLNQLTRYTLPVVAKEMAQEIHFGDKSCMSRKNVSTDFNIQCMKLNETGCANYTTNNSLAQICEYNYNGQGSEYQLVAGPVFILIYTFMGIFISYFADLFQRKRVAILSFCLFFWSTMTLLSGFINDYWQLILTRFGLGFGQAGCTPLATSLISDYFVPELRGSALGIYNWGIYTGYSMSIAIGNPILKHLGWRWVFIICGIPGLAVAILMFFSIKQVNKEPTNNRQEQDSTTESRNFSSTMKSLKRILVEFLKPSLLVLCIASSIRNAAGYVWGYNYNSFYREQGQTPDQIASWLGWIPIVGGLLGSFLGGFVSDRIVKTSKPYKRIWVLVLSQIIATPFIIGVLYFKPPYSYICLIPGYIFGEMWVGVCLSVVVELMPENLRNSAVGFYFFIISNIGGNMQNLLPPIQKSIKERFKLDDFTAFKASLYIFYPGEYVLGSALFLLTLFVLKYDLKRVKDKKSNDDLTQSANQLITNTKEDDRGYDNPAMDSDSNDEHQKRVNKTK